MELLGAEPGDSVSLVCTSSSHQMGFLPAKHCCNYCYLATIVGKMLVTNLEAPLSLHQCHISTCFHPPFLRPLLGLSPASRCLSCCFCPPPRPLSLFLVKALILRTRSLHLLQNSLSLSSGVAKEWGVRVDGGCIHHVVVVVGWERGEEKLMPPAKVLMEE